MKRYWMPTPAKYRKLGDAILATSTMLSTAAVADDWPKWLCISLIVFGGVGKFLTNFFGPGDDKAVS